MMLSGISLIFACWSSSRNIVIYSPVRRGYNDGPGFAILHPQMFVEAEEVNWLMKNLVLKFPAENLDFK